VSDVSENQVVLSKLLLLTTPNSEALEKKLKKITLRYLAKKIEEKSEKVLKFLQIEPRGPNCTEKHQK
ncbi:hypothetical protein CGJ18_15190, partial [Vibrio parahaemolyticus]|uniref:hypothetical protein n=1 Tax=Vibrio parahaemolyticus TaxID=670 RepID=UPI00116F544C